MKEREEGEKKKEKKRRRQNCKIRKDGFQRSRFPWRSKILENSLMLDLLAIVE